MRTKTDIKGSWVVELKCTVIKEVICDNCTEQEARDDPWSKIVSQRELDMPDWEVLSVEPNA